ncbi:hypothetical protein PINS_up024094 [Pythium insidiosum]|nr:hypothetical protein PINS_up024094 [Pythium insidiosum]
MQSGGDVERALSSIRARADHLRRTIARLEHNLAWVPSTWPELLSQYIVISKQLENMNDEIPDMDPEMEEDDRQLMADKPRDRSVVESLEETFREMSDGLLKSIRMNKYATKTRPQSTQSHQFKFIESGTYE